MRFLELEIPGLYSIEIEPIRDDRGFFARTWCRDELTSHGLVADLVQCSISFNIRKGTLRGMHYQRKPDEETKIVRCTQGRIYDVVVDLRAASPTFKRWVGIELSEDNHRMLYVPRGLAHGFLTLEDRCEVSYQMSDMFVAEAASGVRWNDPAFGIQWPEAVRVISKRDAAYEDFTA